MGKTARATTTELPETLRKKLRAFRSIPGTADPAPAKKIVQWVRRAYPSKRYKYWKHTHEELFAAGLSTKNHPKLAPHRREAHALLKDFDLEKVAKASLETLAVAEHMVWHITREESLTPVIAEARGLPDAIRVAVRAARLTTESDRGYTTSVHIAEAKKGGHYNGDGVDPLRHLVCSVDEASYQAARQVAEALRKKGDEDDRILLSALFPDEPWGTADLDASLTKKRPPHTSNPAWPLVGVARDASVVKRWLDAEGPFHIAHYAVAIACNLHSAALPIFQEALAKTLEKPKYGPLHKTPPREVAEGLMCIDSNEAASILASYSTHAILGPNVLGYFRDHPERGKALVHLAKAKGGKLEATAARVLGKTSAANLAVAKKSDMPDVLTRAPWRQPSAEGKPTIVRGLKPLGLHLETVVITKRVEDYADPTLRDMTKSELASWKKDVDKEGYAHCDYEHRSKPASSGATRHYEILRVPDKEGLWAWNEKSAYLSAGYLPWVKKHGLKTIPGFLKRPWGRWFDASEEEADLLDAVRSLRSPRIAVQLAEVALRKKRHRFATTWLLENAEVSAYGLVPPALMDPAEEPSARNKKKSEVEETSPRELREAAEKALLVLARHGHDKLVRSVAAKYGKEAARGIGALLDRDPLAVKVTIPKAPPFLRMSELPQVTLAGGKKGLDDEAKSALVEMLRFTTTDDPYAGIALVRDACDAASLGELAMELFEQWVIADAPGRHDWMLNALVHFQTEKGTRRLAEAAREWARKNGAKAERACVALADIGSDLALMHLAHIAETTRFASLKKAAAELVHDAAGARKLTEDELGDRTVPDAGLGREGAFELTYGPRAFFVSVNQALEPVVREKTKAGLGAVMKSLPRPAKTDDATLAKKAKEQFDAFKKDLGAIAQRQVRRLERAMTTGRTWSVADFEERIVRHPLLRHLAQGLVWEVVEGSRTRTFRVDEANASAKKGSYADERDKAFALPKQGLVRIAHPARTPELGKTWGQVFGDYQIVQPFDQLARAVTLPTAAEKKAKSLDRAAKIRAPARKMLGTMESRGWSRDDNGHVGAWLKRSGDLEARWPITPGISMEDLRSAPDVTTETLEVIGKDGKVMSIGALDVVFFSEIGRDIDAVRGLSS